MKMTMENRHVRIAELTEGIEKLNYLIELHQQNTQSRLMIEQYKFKKDELLSELRLLFNTPKLKISLAEMA